MRRRIVKMCSKKHISRPKTRRDGQAGATKPRPFGSAENMIARWSWVSSWCRTRICQAGWPVETHARACVALDTLPAFFLTTIGPRRSSRLGLPIHPWNAPWMNFVLAIHFRSMRELVLVPFPHLPNRFRNDHRYARHVDGLTVARQNGDEAASKKRSRVAAVAVRVEDLLTIVKQVAYNYLLAVGQKWNGIFCSSLQRRS